MTVLRKLAATAAVAGSFGLVSNTWAATEIQWWHAFTGRLGEVLAGQVEAFNGSQSDYKVVAVYKGNYSET